MPTKLETKVLITRPCQQAGLWATKLQALGINSLCLPLMEIMGFDDKPEQEQWVRPIKNCILDLDLFHKIIFVSQNAVEQGMRWIDVYWPQIPQGIQFFAIGESTANRLRAYGLTVENLATDTDMTSESLLQHPALQQVNDEKILIIRGVGGRGFLGDELQQRGAQVKYCEVYQRALATNVQAAIEDWLDNHPLEHYLISFHSAETWRYFVELLQKIQLSKSTDIVSRLKPLPLLLPSVRLQQEVNKSGFHNTILALNATDEAMTQALNLYFSE